MKFRDLLCGNCKEIIRKCEEEYREKNKEKIKKYRHEYYMKTRPKSSNYIPNMDDETKKMLRRVIG